MLRLRWWLVLGLAGVSLAACTDPVDKAAKQRIFSPEDPPKVIASASEKLTAEGLAEGARVTRRVLEMSAAEATERIGPHKYTAAVNFSWSGGNRPVELQENRTLVAGKGGVNGDFHATVQNSRDQGLDVMRVDGAVYARSRYGKYRQRLRDRGMAEREREEVFGALRDFDALFKGRLKLEPAGTATHEGRTAWKYTVTLAPAATAVETVAAIPPPVQPKGGVDATTHRRQLFFDKREPATLQGELLVDAETSVVVKAKLDGRLTVPPNETGKPASVHLTLDSVLSDIGVDPKLKAPEDFLPDQDKPEGIAATLDRFGVPRGGIGAADGGTPGKGGKPGAKPADEPGDDDSQ